MRLCLNGKDNRILPVIRTHSNDTGNVFGKHRTVFIMFFFLTQKFPVSILK